MLLVFLFELKFPSPFQRHQAGDIRDFRPYVFPFIHPDIHSGKQTISGAPLGEFICIWHKCALGHKDELIRIWWPKVRGHFNLTNILAITQDLNVIMIKFHMNISDYLTYQKLKLCWLLHFLCCWVKYECEASMFKNFYVLCRKILIWTFLFTSVLLHLMYYA